MTKIYITKIERAISRPLTQSERGKAAEFLAAGYSVNYAIEYFK